MPVSRLPVSRLFTHCGPVLACFVLGTGLAHAQLVTEPLADDKYHVVQLDDGVLRIDRQSGEITQCAGSPSGWVCRLSADDRTAYESEINRLDGELQRLRDEVAALESALEAAGGEPSVVPPAGVAGQDEQTGGERSLREELNLPSDEELDVMVDTAEEAMRRFIGMVQRLREDVQQNLDGAPAQ
jgi:hypothetical protein